MWTETLYKLYNASPRAVRAFATHRAHTRLASHDPLQDTDASPDSIVHSSAHASYSAIASTSSLFLARPVIRSFSASASSSSTRALVTSGRRNWDPLSKAGISARRGFASSSISAGWIPSFQWRSNPAATEVTSASNGTGFVPEHSAAAPTPGAADIVTPSPATPSTTTPAEPSVSAAATAPPQTSSTAAEAVNTSADAAATATEPTFYLPGDSHIFSGTLDLTSLAGAWGPHPIQRLQSMFLHLHESFPLIAPTTGLPWYILIPTVTIGLRMLLFWFQVRANANAARLAIIQPQMLAGMEKVKQAKARNDMTSAQAAQMETAALMKRHKVNPIKNLVFPLAQGTVFMVMFFALKGLANAGLPSMAQEGFGWVQDLTQRDPTWVLPIASSALTLATLELGVDKTTTVQTTTTKNMKMAFRFLLVISIPFIGYFPAALLLFWCTNNSISLLQSQILKLEPVRAFFNIPTPPPKALPGQKGYIKEPSFSEAFKNMQTATKEMSEQAAEKSRAQKEIKNKDGQQLARAEMYVPTNHSSKIGKVEEVARSLTPDGALKGAKGVIRAESPIDLQDEKIRRVQAARERRHKMKQ
ncbi:BZ3500_MvSof-1268-A1-R1_Chr12-2g03870 [Microbotryum saponariae]|uniref:BZ3500_MvSof-1268-A1-R1_Chr12-2g03870 protein n=1 Tax=Microbotryum saponariae TaxID=289078 RepID=A0A2X0MR64_9BASI|nr:BZ3500_MvSof-1268-A1-R1_Chr12-2g03870 [Microbotryum saponariae]